VGERGQVRRKGHLAHQSHPTLHSVGPIAMLDFGVPMEPDRGLL
jgi:hypothetical protein